MPRENSFSDSEGRSLTPDLDDEFEAAQTIAQAQDQAQQRDGGEAADDQVPRVGILGGTTMVDPPKRHVRSSIEIFENTLSAPALLDTVVPKSPTSPTRNATRSASHVPTRPAISPGDRFRQSVRKVMAMRRTSTIMARGGVGAEPGIDPRRESAFLNYGHIRQECTIEVVDYSSLRSSFGRMGNADFVKYMTDSRASQRDPWVRVRWINVGGISWDVISALAIKLDMHPLALEDVLHQRGHARSKADYYQKHLFVRVLCHSLGKDGEEASSGSTPTASMTQMPRSSSPAPMKSDDEDEDEDDERSSDWEDGKSRVSHVPKKGTMRNTMRRRFGGTAMQDIERTPLPRSATMSTLGSVDKAKRKNQRNLQIIKELKKGERVNVHIAPIYIFLFRDGTVVSIHKDQQLDFTTPIADRLRQRDTGLRTTADPSLLVQSLIDLVVDQALEVVEEYQSKILSLEHNVLIKPTMKSVRRLHILQEDLILHKRTMEPIKTVIYGLRRYDVDRVAALYERLDPAVKVEGFMSHKAKIYLADVHDHMEYILASLDMFAGISENLINYTFNMTSYEMNEVMRRLTLATIIFLPLTLLTGYFGMNFDNMWTVHHGHSDAIFWYIAVPVLIVVLPMFLWNDFARMWHYMKKRYVQRTVKKEVKKSYRKSQ